MMEYVSELNQRLCNHPADFSVRMVDYSKWDKLQTSDEEDAKPQPPPIPVPWKPCSDLEHPTSCLGDWRNCLFWKLLVTGYMQHVSHWCEFIEVQPKSPAFPKRRLHPSDYHPERSLNKDEERSVKTSRLAWSWAGYSKIFKAVHSLKLTYL